LLLLLLLVYYLLEFVSYFFQNFRNSLFPINSTWKISFYKNFENTTNYLLLLLLLVYYLLEFVSYFFSKFS